MIVARLRFPSNYHLIVTAALKDTSLHAWSLGQCEIYTIVDVAEAETGTVLLFRLSRQNAFGTTYIEDPREYSRLDAESISLPAQKLRRLRAVLSRMVRNMKIELEESRVFGTYELKYLRSSSGHILVLGAVRQGCYKRDAIHYVLEYSRSGSIHGGS